MGENGIGEVWKVQVVGFCGTPRQDDYIIVKRTCNAVGRYTQINFAVHGLLEIVEDMGMMRLL
jgi:hypothetical protein